MTDPSQQSFHPGISMSGAVDLSSIQHQVAAQPGEKGGAPAAGGYVIDVTTNTFNAVVQTSTTYPVLLLLWIPDDDRLFPYAQSLADAVDRQNGAIQLARINIQQSPEIAQALRVRGVPVLYALIAGNPIPLFEGVPQPDEMKQLDEQVIPKIIESAHQAGVNGTAPRTDPVNGVDAQQTSEPSEPEIPPEHHQARDLAMQGDYAAAAREYHRLCETNPQDTLASREEAKALLLARSGSVDVRVVRQAGADKPDDEDTQLAVADIDMIGGQVEDAFSRLLDFASGHPASLDAVRRRLLEYFRICGESDPRVKHARRSLAALMY
ncbi:MAG: tetratricopeptide repeat protein [Bifidobacteriaceae bacterium]|nr:tetratricopeptide repeat protein [Bifidobacteriaceae bacterium]